jgi:hypothetical protein
MNNKIRKIHRPVSNKYQRLNNPRIIKDHAEYIKTNEKDAHALVFVPYYSMIYYSLPPFKTSNPMYKKVK